MSSFFERNTTLKIISIFIALILWGMTPNNRDPLSDWSFRDIPIKIENQQKLSENGLMISSEIQDTYSFDIRAKYSMIKFLDKSKIFALVNLSDINKTGEQKVSVAIQGLPVNIEIKSAPDIKINIERIVPKTIPVLPNVADKDNLELGKRHYEINPRFIEVRGPESLIETVSHAQVALSLGVKDKIMERSLMVQLLDDKDEVIKPEFITINPEYCIVTVYPYKTIRVNPVITGKPAEGYIVMGEEVKPGEVLISGNPEVLDVLESIPTDILDIEGATGDVVRELKLQQQEDIKLSPGQSSFVQVLVRIEKIVDRTVDIGNVELRNVPDGLEANLDEMSDGMTITLRGPQSLAAAFKPEDLRIFMDLNDSSRGERKYPIAVDNLPAGLEISNIEPNELKVIIK